jgi:hypothetical protein
LPEKLPSAAKTVGDNLRRMTDEISLNPGSYTQHTIDIYQQVIDLVVEHQVANKRMRNRNRPTARAVKKKKKVKRYAYARTQELFKSSPSTLAQYMRQYTSANRQWISHNVRGRRRTMTNCGATVLEHVPFSDDRPAEKIAAEDIFYTISNKEVKDRVK